MTLPSEPQGDERRKVLAIILLGHFLTISSIGSLTVALPAIQREFDASSSDLQWTLALYQVGFAVLLITAGRLGDLFGQRRVFIIGMVAFALTSAMSGLAPTMAILIAARLFQGLAGGLVAPQVLSIIQLVYKPHERAGAYSVFSMVSGGGFVTGQLLSGLLIDANLFGIGWRAVFALSTVVSAGAVAGAAVILPKLPRRGGTIDTVGVLLISTFGLVILYPVIQGRSAGWSLSYIIMLLASVPILALFIIHQQRRTLKGKASLVDLTMFKRPTFTSGLILNVIFSFQSFGPYFLITLTVQLGFGLSATQAALLAAVTAVTMISVSARMARLPQNLGRRAYVLSGALGMAGVAATAIATMLGSSPPNVLRLIPALMLFGAFAGVFLPSAVDLTLSEMPLEHAGSASGVTQTAQQLAGAIGAAVFGTVFFGVLDDRSSADAYIQALNISFLLALAGSVLLIVLSRVLTCDPARHDLETDDHVLAS